MDLQEIGVIVSLLISSGAIAFIFNLGARLARMELKTDTIWEFQIRRAMSEVVQNKIGTMNSPIVIKEEVKEWIGEIKYKLRDFYRKLGRNMTDKDLLLEIERNFGDELLSKVCIPHELSQGACLLIALEVAKEV